MAESDRLRAAWMQYDSEMLDRYLVADVEHPRINLQSIISRCFLIDTIFPNEFTQLIREESRFSICLNFLLRLLKNAHSELNRNSILDALEHGAEKCAGVRIPSYLRDSFELLRRPNHDIPDYITEALIAPLCDSDQWLPDSALSTFEQIWTGILSQRRADKISVLEPACGSANDYRYLRSFGLSPFLKYMGFDLCPKNITNARRRFPPVRFEVANVLDIPVDNDSYDYLFLHDLLEHLSPAALDTALAEICRVIRKQAVLSFFNMADIDEHVVTPVGLYHWNTLSLKKIRQALIGSARDVDVIHIDTFLKDSFSCPDYHNQHAYTLIVSFDIN
jgi:hypothetical protein